MKQQLGQTGLHGRAIWRNPLLLALGLIILAGLILRVWGISFGLPFVYHPDEGFEVNRALQLASGSFDFTRITKGGYFYVIFVEFGFLFVFMKLSGMVDSTKEFAMLYISDPSYFYLIGRFTTAVIGTISLYLTYQLASRAFSRLAGVIAALFLCVNLLHVQHSRYITVDMPLTCLCLAALIFILNISEGRGGRNYIWAAVFIALASMTKLPGIVLFLPFFVAHLMHAAKSGQTGIRAIFGRDWIVACGVFVAVYVLGNPGIVIHFKTVMLKIFGLYGMAPGAGLKELTEGELPPSATFEFNPVMFYLSGIESSMGLLVFGLGLAGMFLALAQRNAKGVLLLLFAAIFFLGLVLATDFEMAYARYTLPVIPIWTVFAAAMLVWLMTLLRNWLAVNPARISPALAVLISLPALIGSVQATVQSLAVDSRTQVKHWIDENAPENSRILIEGMTAQTYKLTAPIVNSVENTRAAIEYFKANGESGKARFFELELEARKDKRFDLVYFLWDRIKPLEVYKAENVEYIILRPEELSKTLKYMDSGPQFVRSVQNDPDFELVKTFYGELQGGNGPMIEIYRRSRQDSSGFTP